MADHTHIEWTDATWNVITGCTVVSAGCKHCYAMKLAGTRLKDQPSRAGLTRATAAGPVWTGEVRFNEQWLDQPLRWTRPRKVFVCAHGDLFHENVPVEWLDRVFAVMARAPQHTFQVLTKRPDRMLNYFMRRALVGDTPQALLDAVAGRWPLPNVWLGVSVEDQAAADARIPLLLQCPAAVRWISAEPLLGPVDLTKVRWAKDAPVHVKALRMATIPCLHTGWMRPRIDWVVVGGESGPGARPMHPRWARDLREQCAAAGVPFLFKQWGDWGPIDSWEPWDRKAQTAIRHDGTRMPDDEWSEDGQRFKQIGKKAAGRQLDGRQHDGYPEVSRA